MGPGNCGVRGMGCVFGAPVSNLVEIQRRERRRHVYRHSAGLDTSRPSRLRRDLDHKRHFNPVFVLFSSSRNRRHSTRHGLFR